MMKIHVDLEAVFIVSVVSALLFAALYTLWGRPITLLATMIFAVLAVWSYLKTY